MAIKMIQVSIPYYKKLDLKYLVLDYNGTLAELGKVKDSTKELLIKLSEELKIYIITADTFGSVLAEVENLPVEVQLVSSDNGTIDKENLIKKLGKKNCVAIGNGNNDLLMIKEAELGICLLGHEGCAKDTLLASDLVIKSIDEALGILINKDALVATLRK
jgi:P-type E1-E2 ATPase